MKWYDLDDPSNRDPKRIERWMFLAPLVKRYFRAEVRGLERIPSGAALYVGNHNGGLVIPDTFIFCGAVLQKRGIEDLPYGLGHEVAFKLPVIHQVFAPLGALRASHEAAARVFSRGAKALVYPGGDLDAMRPYRHRHRIVFGGRRGYIRLALRHDVPIVPVVAAGAHGVFVVIDDLRWLARLLGADRWLRVKVWPLSLSIPWGLTLGPPPLFIPLPRHIIVESLAPIRFERSGDEAAADEAYVAACAARVEAEMQEALTRLAAEL